ncbi:MAG: hypothetical protein COW00_15195 [Bdellovibrio sp. CG12_big_fil_rev_8_21_14_0_65_39_13]|nr:MAG: hypothetical protein COW78_14165 [Bdellovibrio sp. CG22_combo_CG10-13_8_21_14_all_39_27]PIQ58541.1 MAG: hypothetical protein COW00_15195 [Bdellovibrio sp. CG12_big_fil_rev_8_21_14_0_65_39_13]PIR34150.1 MAG: hypothetical protein COV37_13650 [Bdellovibrio sp. CG11_big_fil_rev_8_21_14_0_20_39_38]
MEENFNLNIYDALAERVKNPISGTFSLIWFITNWQVPIILVFGTTPEQDRISVINLYITSKNSLLPLVIYPLLLTLAYLLIMPILKEWYNWWINRSDYRISRAKQKLELDLQEESQYRETLRSLCAGLKKVLNDSSLAFQEISDTAKQGQEKKNIYFYEDIDKLALEKRRYSELTVKQIEHFFENYNADIPDNYQLFLLKWGKKTLKALANIGPKIK